MHARTHSRLSLTRLNALFLSLYHAHTHINIEDTLSQVFTLSDGPYKRPYNSFNFEDQHTEVNIL